MKKYIVKCFHHIKYRCAKETRIDENNDDLSVPMTAFIELIMFFYQVKVIFLVKNIRVTDDQGLFESLMNTLTQFFHGSHASHAAECLLFRGCELHPRVVSEPLAKTKHSNKPYVHFLLCIFC